MKKRLGFSAIAICLFTHTVAASTPLWTRDVEDSEADTIVLHDLAEIHVTASPKESETLRRQPASVTLMGRQQMEQQGVMALKGVGSKVPGLFIPDYGSRQTSAVYMRGIGSRIGTPAVGMYVDNVPYYDKSAFDFSFYNIESLEVLRGPQSTLYGRNTMGGLVKVNTRSPFYNTGTDVHLGFATGDLHRHVALTHYHHVSDKFAFAGGGFYDGGSGFFDNDMTGKRVDGMESGGGRLRAIYKPTDRLTLDASLHYEYTDEGAYPYYYTGVTSGMEEHGEMVGLISANLEGRYRRSLLNAGLHTEYRMPTMTLHSVTAYQNIGDRMFMDQDFLQDDIYSLEQKQHINVLSEELTLKGFRRGNAQGLLGASFFYQWQGIQGPVTFRKDGVGWLNGVINQNANHYMPSVQAGPMTMKFLFSDNIQGERLGFLNDFSTPTLGAALFHQLTLSDIFGAEGLSATLGLRLDYEKAWMEYSAWYDFEHVYGLQGHLTSPFMNKDINMVPSTLFGVSNHTLVGKVSQDHLQLLPRLAIKYEFPKGNIYGSVSRGFRSGGYNVQNISEMMRSQMQADMMCDVRDATLPVLQSQPMVPADTKTEVSDILNRMAEKPAIDVAGACGYRPEYAWNYEVGTHLNLLDEALRLDASVYLSDVHDLQLSQMSETGLGRVIVNAVRSRSVGTELSVLAKPVQPLALTGTYGYTHASFLEYQTDGVDCHGCLVPYMPQHTFSADAAYTFDLEGKVLDALTLGATCSGAGSIYWDEQNIHKEPFYTLLSARVMLSMKHLELTLWGKNLTDRRYNTFWFQSMNRGFEQHGKPLQVGVDVRINLPQPLTRRGD